MVELEKLIIITAYKIKVIAEINQLHKKFIHFSVENDCETPYIEIYIDLLSINFHLLSALSYFCIVPTIRYGRYKHCSF